MKGVIYTRVSSDEQIDGTSLDFQEESCRQYCKDKGIEVQELFREEGVSAKSTERPAFLRAIEYCRKSRKIDAFIVAKVDRFARNTEDHFAVRKALLDYGTKLHSVTEPIGDDPAEKLFETILAGFSDFDNAVRKQRSADGMSTKLNQGIWPWKPPVGYLCEYHRKQGKKKTTPDRIDPATFQIVQQGLQEYSLGIYNKAALARRLDKLGLKSAMGRRTYKQFIDQLLAPKRLKYYAGILENHWTGKDIPGLHKSMLTKDEYERIVAIESGRRPVHTKKLKRNPKFPLRRTLICTGCKTFVSASSPRGVGGVYHYYHCIKRECPRYAKHMSRDQAEKDFRSLLATVIPTDEALDRFKERVRYHFGMWKTKEAGAEGRYNKTMSALEARRERIFEMREDGSYTVEEFDERKRDVDQKLSTLRSKRPTGSLSSIDGILDKAFVFITKLPSTWSTFAPELRHEFQKLVFPEGVSYTSETRFGTPLLGCLFRLFGDSGPQKSHLVRSTRSTQNSSKVKENQQMDAWSYEEWQKFLDELQQWAHIADMQSDNDRRAELGREK